jgi:alpha-1,3-glucosyltransferase
VFDPASVELHASQGYETAYSKLLMRWTVLISDILCRLLNVPVTSLPCYCVLIAQLVYTAGYFPAAIACAAAYTSAPQDRVAVLGTMLFNPALIIIDHGHFQYNCISLGLAVGAS